MILTRRPAAPRRAFTLTELLVVITIIALLIGLLLPALSGVRTKARETDNFQHMQQIATAVTNFQTKMRVEYIPAYGGGNNGVFRLRSQYYNSPANATQISVNSPEALYLKQLFPQLPPNNLGFSTGLTTAQERDMDPNQTLTFFLTGADITQYQGFSNNRQQPFNVGAAADTRIGPFLETKPTDFDATGTRLLDKFGVPYAYFSAHVYNTSRQAFVTDYGNGAYSQTYTPAGTVQAYATAPGRFLNPKSFQIISAGANKLFGPGGVWAPGQGVYDQRGAGYDDFGTFQKARLGESD
jgi:prepilin-type N-terminal cleavage/methylation domain-containing protein